LQDRAFAVLQSGTAVPDAKAFPGCRFAHPGYAAPSGYAAAGEEGVSSPHPSAACRGFPESREINRELLEISHDSGLAGRFWEPVAKRIQQLAANSLLLRKQRIFLSEQRIRLIEQGNGRVEWRKAEPRRAVGWQPSELGGGWRLRRFNHAQGADDK